MAPSDPILARLLAEHTQLRDLAATLGGMLAASEPPSDGTLTDTRWSMARLMLRHLPVEDRHVFRRLEAHDNPAVRARMAGFRIDLNALYGAYQHHGARWTEDTVRADWFGYRAATRHLLASLTGMMDREESELYPLLDDAPAAEGRAPDARNWAGDAWAIRANLGR
ncbi:hemerythrin domain-containing protein [uncultured Sphingomonas sp.]|uniref:hemerythrin domain-containing protein n=1 Tax=uncultured Sphingomonas sp. TaxID=158754 RepID=UPI0025E6F8A9|nr:hemerythrin domain-containing protein [uncultured Sphingomonas sp.]